MLQEGQSMLQERQKILYGEEGATGREISTTIVIGGGNLTKNI